ncbi:MAG: hypothetical protein ACYDAN_06620 [Candidatus Limnocylindrales bacterium]
MNTSAGINVRRGGTLGLPGGRRMVWTVAQGAKGRRWRAVTTHGDGRMEAGLLVETAADGRLTKLELATGEGLLTLHPEGDPVRLHGNVVRASGIDHVSLPWSSAHLLMACASPVTAAVAVASAAASVGVGEGTGMAAVEVGIDLRLRTATWRVARVGERRWHLLAADGGPSLLLELDADGLPTAAHGASWPLDVEGPIA